MPDKAIKSNAAIKSAAKGAGIVFIGIFLSKILGYLYRAIVARIGPEQYGLLSIGLAVIGIVSFFPLCGLDLGVVRFVSFYKGKNDYARIKGVILSSLKITIVLSLIFMILLILFSKSIATGIYHNEDLINIIKILALVIPCWVVSNIFLAVIRAFQRMEYHTLIKNVLENLIKVILTAALIYFGFGLIGATVAYVIAISTTLLLSFFFLKNKVFNIFSETKPLFVTRDLLKYSWPLMFSLLFAQVIVWTDLLMLGYFRNASEVGIYNAALPTITLMSIIPGALMSLFVPLMTEMYARDDKDGLKRLFKTIAKWIFFSNIIVFFLINLFAKEILSILFGRVYGKGALALVILSAGYFIYYNLFITSSQMLEVIKKTNYVMINSVITAILNIALNYFLIPKYGMIGGAIATTVSLGIYGLLSAIEIFIITGLIPLKLNYIKSIISGFVSASIVYYISKNINVNVVSIVILSVVFVIIYILLIVILRCLEREDVEILKAVERKTNIRLGFFRDIVKKFI